MTFTSNHIYNLGATIFALLLALNELPAPVLALIPAKIRPYVILIPLIAMWIKSHVNLGAQPPSTNPPGGITQ